MFPDASDEHWWRFLTQVPQGVLDRGVPVEDMTHEPLGFVSGTFKGSHQRWATVDMEGFAMVTTFKRLEYLLWNGVHIYTDHKNLAYIFALEAYVSSVAETAEQGMDQWRAVLRKYDYTIMHIAGDRNCCDDLLLRWLNVPSVSARTSAVHASSEPDDTLPSKQAIWDAQQVPRANLGTLAAGATSFMTGDSQVTLDDEGLFRLQGNARALLWISEGAKELQLRLMVCAHMKEAGHRGAVATLQRRSEYCGCFRMEEHITEFVSVSIAWILKRGRRCLIRLGRPCTAPGRANLSTLTISMLEQVCR